MDSIVSRMWRRLRTPRVAFSTSIPVVIMCRDLVTPLQDLMAWLDAEGMSNVILVDNQSTYPPLLEYLATAPATVLYLGENRGHHSAWDPRVRTLVGSGPYIVTDPDVVPLDEAHGAITRFVDLLNRYPAVRKVGFGLLIDDLPEQFAYRDDVIAWERGMWERELEPGVFGATIDTTFALYRGDVLRPTISPAMRTGFPYVARHVPWYYDTSQPTEEWTYYVDHARREISSVAHREQKERGAQ